MLATTQEDKDNEKDEGDKGDEEDKKVPKISLDDFFLGVDGIKRITGNSAAAM